MLANDVKPIEKVALQSIAIGVFDEVNLDNKSYWGDTVIVKKAAYTYPVSVANRAFSRVHS